MNQLLLLRFTGIVFSSIGILVFLAGLSIIESSDISGNQELKWLSISISLPVILMAGITMLRPSMANKHRSLWYIMASVIICIVPILVLLTVWYPSSGFDMNIGCSAVYAWEDGFDPYIAKHISMYSGYLYSYGPPPISILGVKLVCLYNPRVAYYTIWSLCLLATFIILIKAYKGREALLLMILLLSGFATVLFNFWTGNAGIPQMLLFSLIIVFILKDKYYIAAFLLGITASLNIWPLAFGALFLFAPKPVIFRLKLIILSFAAFALVNLSSYILFPDITDSYYQSVAGMLDSQHSPVKEILEGGSMANPAPVLGMKTISNLLFGETIAPLVILEITYVGFIGFTFFNYTLRRNHDFLCIFSLGVLSILLIMPRLQAYSFVFALIPMYLLMTNFSLKDKFVALLIVSVTPLISILICMLETYKSTDIGLFWQQGAIMADDPDTSLLGSLTCYGQGASLLIFYVYYLIRSHSFGFRFLLFDKLSKGRSQAQNS